MDSLGSLMIINDLYIWQIWTIWEKYGRYMEKYGKNMAEIWKKIEKYDPRKVELLTGKMTEFFLGRVDVPLLCWDFSEARCTGDVTKWWAQPSHPPSSTAHGLAAGVSRLPSPCRPCRPCPCPHHDCFCPVALPWQLWPGFRRGNGLQGAKNGRFW